MSNDLFGNPVNPTDRDLKPTFAKVKKKQVRGKKGEQCQDCKNCVSHHYRNDWVYCKVQGDPRTSNGCKKIRKMDAKCSRFEPESGDK